MESTSADHAKRIDRTLIYIDDHLGDQLDLGALAAIACFSKFHFHRVFKRVAGVSPQEYVRRRRLEMAYHFLSNDSTLGVNEVSDLLGFSSPSNFARSFRNAVLVPSPEPESALRPIRSGPGRRARARSRSSSSIPSLVRLETLAPFRVLFARRKGSPIDPPVIEHGFLEGLGGSASGAAGRCRAPGAWSSGSRSRA